MITPPQQVLILGSGSFAEEVADVISEIPQVTLAGFVENQDGSLTGELLRGLPIYWVAPAFPRTRNVWWRPSSATICARWV